MTSYIRFTARHKGAQLRAAKWKNRLIASRDRCGRAEARGISAPTRVPATEMRADNNYTQIWAYQYSTRGIIHRLLHEAGGSARSERPRGSEIGGSSSWEKPEESATRAESIRSDSFVSVTRACMRACERTINTYRDTSRSIAYSARVFCSASTPEIDLSRFPYPE